MSQSPSSTLKLGRWFTYELVVLTVFVIVTAALVVYPWLETVHPIFNAGTLGDSSSWRWVPTTLRDIVTIVYVFVVIFGYIGVRMMVGPALATETYTLPMTLPDGGWTELVLTPPDADESAEFSLTEYEDIPLILPDLVPTPSVGAAEREPEPIRIDREALDLLVADATALSTVYEEYGVGLLFPWNWPTTARRVKEIETARKQLDALSVILDKLPSQNVAYESTVGSGGSHERPEPETRRTHQRERAGTRHPMNQLVAVIVLGLVPWTVIPPSGTVFVFPFGFVNVHALQLTITPLTVWKLQRVISPVVVAWKVGVVLYFGAFVSALGGVFGRDTRRLTAGLLGLTAVSQVAFLYLDAQRGLSSALPVGTILMGIVALWMWFSATSVSE